MATNFSVKIGEIGLFTFIRRPGIQNGLQYRHSDFKKVICDDVAIFCVNLVNVGPVTLEFNIDRGSQHHVSFFKTKLLDKYTNPRIHRTDFHNIFTVW